MRATARQILEHCAQIDAAAITSLLFYDRFDVDNLDEFILSAWKFLDFSFFYTQCLCPFFLSCYKFQCVLLSFLCERERERDKAVHDCEIDGLTICQQLVVVRKSEK